MNVIDSVDSVKYSILGQEPYATPSYTYVYKNLNGEYRVVENGERLSRAEMKLKRFTTRYRINQTPIHAKIEEEFSSQDIGDNFLVDINITIKINQFDHFIESRIEDVETDVKKQLKMQIKKACRQYKVGDISEVEHIIPDQLNTDELEKMGLKIMLDGDVDLSEELKQRLKNHRRSMEDVDLEKEIKNKKAEELLEIFQGTPVGLLLPLYDDVSEFKMELRSKVKELEKSKTMIREKFVNGTIDEVQYMRAKSILGDSILPAGQNETSPLIEEKQAGNSFKNNDDLEVNNSDDEEWS
ncbi:hypothetical protein [Chengkuizengella axinellae]|uniref:Band 7 domain-containing protein n=1 Tax=Chengkuizengella axinellae TaxID=3064388 RepID=A0ABT9J1T1_9BACL|nr:hypothetical protein [Chengkuizengella sp. 2205SS18-9]MDP5274964.1 hypothetical protein [Chengkuizengella sp. 2205SS18-9]